MSAQNQAFSNPKMIAEAGEKIYRERFKEQFEREAHGKYVVINVRTQTATLGDTPEEAFQLASTQDPKGLFHLIRVGFPSVYSVSYARDNGCQDWIFG